MWCIGLKFFLCIVVTPYLFKDFKCSCVPYPKFFSNLYFVNFFDILIINLSLKHLAIIDAALIHFTFSSPFTIALQFFRPFGTTLPSTRISLGFFESFLKLLSLKVMMRLEYCIFVSLLPKPHLYQSKSFFLIKRAR